MKRERSIADTAARGGTKHPPPIWTTLLLLSAMVCLFFGKILLGAAWLWEDMLYYSYPVRAFAATSIAMGQLPLWNPYTFNGMPFLADIQTTVFYIPCTLLTLFVHNGWLNFYWLEVVVIAHFVLAGWAMYMLARSFGLRHVPALVAGASYMLSGFMITHAIHQQIITMVAWFPLIFLFFRKALLENTWRDVFLCALILGHSTFAGYPQLSLYLHFILFSYFLFTLLTVHHPTALLSRPALLLSFKAAAIVGLGLAIAAIQLLPTAELADLSQRAQITYEKSTEGTLAWSQLITFFTPKFFGTAGAAGYSYWGPGPYWYYWETCIYLGLLPLVLMLLSLFLPRTTPEVLFLWGVALFSLLFALGNNFVIHKFFFDYVPGFSRFRNPARMAIFLSFAASLLSGFTLDKLLHGERKQLNTRRIRTALLSIAAVGIILWGTTVSGMFESLFAFLKNPATLNVVRNASHVSLLLLLLSCAVVYGLVMKPSLSRQAGWILVVVFFVDMAAFGIEQNTAVLNPNEYFRQAEPVVRYVREQSKSDVFRINTRNQFGMILDRNQSMVDRIATMEGYTPLVLQRALPPYGRYDQMLDLLNVKYKTITDRGTGQMSLAAHASYMPRAFFVYDIRVARTEEEVLSCIKDTAWNHRVTAVIEKIPSIPIASEPVRWSAHITGYENNIITLDVETPANGLLVLSEIFYPGWSATIDGTETEILRTNYTLRGIAVLAGSHHVVFRFMPPPFKTGAWITAGALIICLNGVIFPVFRRTRPQEKEQ